MNRTWWRCQGVCSKLTSRSMHKRRRTWDAFTNTGENMSWSSSRPNVASIRAIVSEIFRRCSTPGEKVDGSIPMPPMSGASPRCAHNARRVRYAPAPSMTGGFLISRPATTASKSCLTAPCTFMHACASTTKCLPLTVSHCAAAAPRAPCRFATAVINSKCLRTTDGLRHSRRLARQPGGNWTSDHTGPVPCAFPVPSCSSMARGRQGDIMMASHSAAAAHHG